MSGDEKHYQHRNQSSDKHHNTNGENKKLIQAQHTGELSDKHHYTNGENKKKLIQAGIKIYQAITKVEDGNTLNQYE